MNIYRLIRENTITVLNELRASGALPADADFASVTAEPPKQAGMGDISTNAAMVVAGKAKANPRQMAETIIAKMKEQKAIAELVQDINVAGPGFINLTLKNSVWQKLVASILKEGSSYGNSDIGSGQDMNVEYVSANPTGPMHIGHARGAVVGDVLCLLLLKAGFNVTKEYYINDAGSQVTTLARSAHLRYREALGEDIGDIPEGYYPGEYLKIVGESLAQAVGKKYLNAPEEEWLAPVRDFALEAMLEMIKNDLLALGIRHDVFSSERKLIEEGMVDKTINMLEAQKLVYRGVLEPPKGKTPDDWEPREQKLFRSTEYGDDVDRPLRKSDGTSTYFAGDIAYHYDKLNRGFKKMVLLLGADHSGYVKRMKAAVSAMSNREATLEIIIYQLVNFMENGQPMKMSKRRGTFITLRDVVDAVGKDVTRFIMLTRKADVVLDFDLQKVTEQSRDNPVFYVQYAHARCYSVLRNLANELPALVDKQADGTQLELLTDEAEMELIKTMAQWPRVVEASAIACEPHRIAFYLQELAHAFHQLWNRGKDDTGLKFIQPQNEALTLARMALVKACATTIASGLFVLGVEPLREL